MKTRVNKKMELFIIKVFENDEEKYLYNKRMLVTHVSSARRFSNISYARKYFESSNFISFKYQIIAIDK